MEAVISLVTTGFTLITDGVDFILATPVLALGIGLGLAGTVISLVKSNMN